MEKKRLLPALIMAVLAFPATLASSAEDPVSLQGIRTGPGEAEFSRAKKLMEDLLEPDIAEAEKTLSEINSPGAKETEKIMELLSVKPPPSETFPEKSAGAGDKRPELFYFFSFSIPFPSLREAAQETAAGGAVMVLRGLSGKDLGETASRISDMIGKTGAQVWIDPVLFECFSVGAVPQLVLAYGHVPGADCEGLRHVKVSGDVSLPYALGLMEKEDANAGVFIRRLEESGFYGN
ncbi:MAG: type-F conjugative transfer system pilin assembly protein TrbC [Candidatus Dadabacteria bacterium]|nr:type-F conjugative transfer system pilin assembly protein TrbC [Candidatus Dadabacteria bacterium]MDE0519088.1 type-F conjugative transfer system pilin assembly protein TrbC [Candidatus Dadabacteria bacterium]MDE0663279.1 type-F conjugative transfer system pilin assembly protein TrbC [Candidatus Dadabacteria bacterium]